MNTKLRIFDGSDIGKVIHYKSWAGEENSIGIILNCKNGRRTSQKMPGKTSQCFNIQKNIVESVGCDRVSKISEDSINEILSSTEYLCKEIL